MNLVFLINHMHFLHGRLVADILVFLCSVDWQGNVNKIDFHRPVSLQKLEELDLRDTYGTKPTVQHLRRLRADDPMQMTLVGGMCHRSSRF